MIWGDLRGNMLELLEGRVITVCAVVGSIIPLLIGLAVE